MNYEIVFSLLFLIPWHHLHPTFKVVHPRTVLCDLTSGLIILVRTLSRTWICIGTILVEGPVLGWWRSTLQVLSVLH